jgi:hypothetical protein
MILNDENSFDLARFVCCGKAGSVPDNTSAAIIPHNTADAFSGHDGCRRFGFIFEEKSAPVR